MTIRVAVPLILLLSAACQLAVAQIELSDARSGMNCINYQAGTRFAWQRKGGDWKDADDTEYGDRPFARRDVAKTKGVQHIQWEIIDLTRAWERGVEPSGGIYLRQLAGSGPSVKFHSRESQDPAMRPRLVIDWDDGVRTELTPTADTTITCTSLSGKGGKPNLEVRDNRSAILVFPFESRTDARVVDARLILVSYKQYGATSDIGVFSLSGPFAQNSAGKNGFAAAYRWDAGIDAYPAVVFATGFESADWLDGWSKMSRSSVAERVMDDDNGYEPLSGSALKVTVEEGKKQGLNLLFRFKEKTGSEPEAMYFRYYLRFGDNWEPRVSGKMPGFAGTYDKAGWGGRRPDGTDGWSARGRYTVSSVLGNDRFSLGSYVYHARMSKKYGDGWGWNIGPTGVLAKNQWYSVEQYLKLNDRGENNGVLKAWIDGVPVFERRNIRFRDADTLRIETLWMNVYHGGTKKAPRDISLYIDNLVIASEYIGPAGGVGDAN